MPFLVSAVRSSVPPTPQRRETNYGYYIPMDGGGSMLTVRTTLYHPCHDVSFDFFLLPQQVQNTYPAGLGEPINVIISAYSDSAVLQSTVSNGGVINYYQSVCRTGPSCPPSTCLGRSVSRPNAWVSIPVTIKAPILVTGTDTVRIPFCLSDHPDMFRPAVNQTAVIRWDYGNVQLGTCEETIDGGNHIRYWIQNGSNANSGAIFMAVSYEMPIAGTFLGLSSRTALIDCR